MSLYHIFKFLALSTKQSESSTHSLRKRMEIEAYSEYFKEKKNKVSLAMWVMINNNVVTRSVFLSFITFDFLLQILIIICLYS